MKIVFAIIVYDRYANINHWMDCWEKCGHDAELVVIHNTDVEHIPLYFECKNRKVKYLLRENIGYDSGAFQDVCLNRLNGFPEWDRLLWVTDDVFPMCIDFIQQFNNAMMPGVGVACMEISNFVKPHIRTSAFMITKECAGKLTFPADPVTTKRQCYEFEHMAKKAFLEQVNAMGLTVVQPWDMQHAPLWDSGYMRKLARKKEHENIFGAMPVQPAFISKAEHLKNELLNK